jgi:hypothetical protein
MPLTCDKNCDDFEWLDKNNGDGKEQQGKIRT